MRCLHPKLYMRRGMEYNTRVKLCTKLFTLLSAAALCAPVQAAPRTALPNDDIAEEVGTDELEETVETVKLGGEDRVPSIQEGVGEADAYDRTAAPNAPTNVRTQEAEADPGAAGMPLKDTEAVLDVTSPDPSRVAYAGTRKNARTMSLTVPGPRGLITDRNGEVMVQNTKARVATISCRTAADHCCRIMEESFEGMLLKIDGTEMWTRLIGRHNAYNILAIYCAAVELGCGKTEALTAISKLESARGRLENIPGPDGINVIIDYAHTPDALENVLKTINDVRCHKETLITVVGCGGNRDTTKRPEMAAVAAKMSDKVILTSDNPRNEDPDEIIRQMKEGLDEEAKRHVLSITNRREAIRTAVALASKGDIILLAGKGHENYQEINGVKNHFDDKEELSEALKEK